MSQRHQDYLQTTAAAHTAYLNAAAALLGGAQIPQATLPAPAPALPPPAAPAPQAAAAPPPAPARPAEINIVPAPAAAKPYTNGSAAPQTPAPKQQPTPAPVKTSAGPDPIALVRAIISEKTGYPEDMLEIDMDLEGELGVDSIKQVEILSTLRDRVPELPEIDPEKLVELRTIAAIAAMLGSAPAAAPVAQAAAQPPASAAATSLSNGVTVAVVRSLIAEKTGYPDDMLEEDMDLEGELGVDSIKQVEILSALRDRYPSLPEVDPEDIAELRTIRKIADFFA